MADAAALPSTPPLATRLPLVMAVPLPPAPLASSAGGGSAWVKRMRPSSLAVPTGSQTAALTHGRANISALPVTGCSALPKEAEARIMAPCSEAQYELM